MDIFYVINNLYTNKKSQWIIELDDKELQENKIEPFMIQRFLSMNDEVRQLTRWLDKYTFTISPKMYISLAWSVLPKYQKPPYVPYIKIKTKEDEYCFILPKIRQHLQLSHNDYNALKSRLIKNIETDKFNWFAFYGVPKSYYKFYNLNFENVKTFGETEKKPVEVGLSKWGL